MSPAPRRAARTREILTKAFVWVVLAVFVITSVGVALVSFSTR